MKRLPNARRRIAASARKLASARLSARPLVRWWSLHSYTGVIAALALYLMFLTGGITLFHESLEVWEEPLAQRVRAEHAGLAETLSGALVALGSTPADFWFLPSESARGEARLSYREAGVFRTVWFDAQNSQIVPERERLAHFIYQLHFLWHDATGYWLYLPAGLLAVALLVALTTGLLLQLKNLGRQFHRFRPHSSRRVLWSDLHKVLGVMGLPFQLFYGYSGAFLVLAPLLVPLFIGPVFQGDARRAAAATFSDVGEPSPAAGPQTAVLTLDELVARARAMRPSFTPSAFRLLQHGRGNGVVELWGNSSESPRGLRLLRWRERDGQPDDAQVASSDGAAFAVSRWLRGVHFVAFGDTAVRCLFLFLALASCGLMLTGNAVWLSRRADDGPTHRLLARLNVGVGAGAWVALGALFFASRALPFHVRARGTYEELIFLISLLACVAWAFAARDLTALWSRQLALAGALWLPVPVLATRWSEAGLFGKGPRLPTVVAVDGALITVSLALCACAWLLARPRQSQVAPLSTKNTCLPLPHGDAGMNDGRHALRPAETSDA